MSRKRVLVTGMSGLIGGAVRRHLEGEYSLSALNRSDVPGVKTYQADISDLEAIRPAFQDQDFVVHLAGRLGPDATEEEILRVNVIGTYNVFKAAVEAGVKRIVYASSGATISGYERIEPYKSLVEERYRDVPSSWPIITHETELRPNGVYGASKVWGEALARHLTDTTDMSIICLRFGHVTREDRPVLPRDWSMWCSQRDAANMVQLCLKAPAEMKYDIFFVVSNNKWRYRDLNHARAMLGFESHDNAENYR